MYEDPVRFGLAKRSYNPDLSLCEKLDKFGQTIYVPRQARP